MSIIGIVLLITGIILLLINHYHPAKNHQQLNKFSAYVLVILGLVLVLLAIITFFRMQK